MNKNSLKVYMIGVLGAGMCPLAKLLLIKGFNVSGSDIKANNNLEELKKLGLNFYSSHQKENVKDSDIVIYSSAIDKLNPELVEAYKLNKAVYSRAQVLQVIINCYKKSIGISGTHGKTTTSSMLTNLMANYNISCTSIIGGFDNKFGDIRYSKELKNIVVEVCEFDKNIYKISTNISVCLNIDNDHLNSYADFDELKSAFYSFLDRAKYKFVNVDDESLKNYHSKNVTYFGIKNNCEFMAKNLTSNGGKYSFDLYEKGVFIKRISLNIYGLHNVYNALAVISVLRKIYKIDFRFLDEYISEFSGVKGRFEHICNYKNKQIYCDYAHHPTEIRALVKTLKERFNNDYLLIFQPHTYSRTKMLINDFILAFKGEKVIVYKEYKAREEFDYLGSSSYLAEKLNAVYIDDISKLISKINRSKKNNVIIIGAGDLKEEILKKN